MITSNTILFTIICVFAVQAMIFAGLIALKKPQRLANTFLAMLIVFFALIPLNIVIVNVLKDYNLLYVFRYIQLEMLYGIGPALYFYTKCITYPKFKFTTKHYWHFIPFVLEFIFYRTAIYRLGSDGLYLETLPTYSYVYLTQQWLGIGSILTYSFISLGLLFKHQEKLKDYYSKIDKQSLRWLQTPIILFACYFIFWELLTDIDRLVFDRSLRQYYFLPNFTLLSMATCWVGFKGYIQKERELIDMPLSSKSNKHLSTEKDEEFLEQLQNLMTTKKPYLNPELNLSLLAADLDMKPRQLSAKINENCQQNFYDLVNSYRIEAFKNRLQSADRNRLSLLGHALECGFSSKSTFNLVFKKQTQLTPSAYLKTLKKAS